MLTVSLISSTQHAIGYFAKDNYYTREQSSLDSQWYGRGALALGLYGGVNSDAFTAVLQGKVAGVQLGRVTTDGVQHRPGWDMTFSAPKSVSILSEIYECVAVRTAHDVAVKRALEYAESQLVQARVTIGSATFKQSTGNAIFALFTHDVSRELDPALHTHSVLVNATETPSGWRSLTPELIFQHQKKLGLVYRMALARELTERGYTLRKHDKDPTAFEIAGVPESMIRQFSKRSQQIESYFEQNNIAYDTTLAKKIALLTRQAKRDVERNELRAIWREEAADYSLTDAVLYPRGRPHVSAPRDDKGTGSADAVTPSHGPEPAVVNAEEPPASESLPARINPPTPGENTSAGPAPVAPDLLIPSAGGENGGINPALSQPALATSNESITDTVRSVVAAAIAHLSERDFAFTEMQLTEQAALFGQGQIDLVQVEVAIAERIQSGQLLPAKKLDGDGISLWTTPQAKQLETELLTLLAAGKKVWHGSVEEGRIDAHLEKYSLNEQQANAVRQAALNGDRFFAVQGDPGVGKTTLLKAYKDLLLKNGFDVLAMAPSYQAMAELSESLKLPGMVVDRYLADPNSHRLGRRFRKQVWLVDEAGMLSADKVASIMRLAKERNARIVFVGDHQQLESVGAGRSFYQLLDAGIDHVVLNQRLRQRTDWLKDVVDAVMRKEYVQALTTMSAQGKIAVESSEIALLNNIARDWLALSAEDREQTLVITPTNELRNEVNERIRNGLKAMREVEGVEYTYKTLNDRMLTEQQKRMAQSYNRGDVVRFNQEYKSTSPLKKDRVARHEYFDVIGVNAQTNVLALQSRNDRRTIFVDPAKRGADKKGGLQVYSEQKVSLAAGDKIRWLDNYNQHGLKRNTSARVVRVGSDFIRIETADGKRERIEVNKTNLAHFEPHYARTVYNVQGATTQKIMALMQSKHLNTVNQRSFMVAMTRAQKDAAVYTDDIGKLSQALSKRHGNNTEALTENEFQQEANRLQLRQNQPQPRHRRT